MLDMVEMSLMLATEGSEPEDSKLQIGVEMKPMILFAGSQWNDESASEQATLFRQLKTTMIDLFQGEEISSIDVAGLQYVLMVAAGENNGDTTNSSDGSVKPVIHLRWYRVRTVRSSTPKVPRVELDQIGPSLDFRIGRFRFADPNVLSEAMKHAKRANEARTKKNVETDLMGDKLGRVHLGKQDLSQLQTRKMKGLKRSRDHDDDMVVDGRNGMEKDEDDVISQDEDEEEVGMELNEGSDFSAEGSGIGGSGDEIDIEEDSGDDAADKMPKRQKLG